MSTKRIKFDPLKPHNGLPLLPPRELEKNGVLKSHKMGKENLYLNVKLFKLLSA